MKKSPILSVVSSAILAFSCVATQSCDQSKPSRTASKSSHLESVEYSKLTHEESGYLDMLKTEHYALHRNSSIIRNPNAAFASKMDALSNLRTNASDYSSLIHVYQIPPTMLAEWDIREAGLALLDASIDASSPSELDWYAWNFLAKFEGFKAVVEGRVSRPLDSKTNFVFRPLGNPITVINKEGHFVLSVNVPTPLGSMVMWNEKRSFTDVRYLTVEYRNQIRAYRFRDGWEISHVLKGDHVATHKVVGDKLVVRFEEIVDGVIVSSEQPKRGIVDAHEQVWSEQSEVVQPPRTVSTDNEMIPRALPAE